MPRNPSPRVYAACFPVASGYYQAIFAQDGTELYGTFVPTRSEARYNISTGSHDHDCRQHYPNGYKLVDLTKYSIDELLTIGEFLSAARIENFATPKR